MKRTTLLAIIALLTIPALVFANTGTSLANSKDVAGELTINPATLYFEKTITADDLSEHLLLLSSDEYGGRDTGEKGQKMAAKYISDFYKGLGMPPIIGDSSYYQEYELYKTEWGEVYVDCNGKRYEFLKDFYAFQGSNTKLITSTDEILFLGYGIHDHRYSDYKGVDVKDKILLVYDGEPKKKEHS